jgi:hypothetical protein
VPDGAHSLQLRVETYPDSSTEGNGVVWFDNFKLLAVPDVQGHFFLTDRNATKLQKPDKVSYRVSNPTDVSVQVSGARSPFYLATSETYNPQWMLKLNGATGAGTHVRLNAATSGWYIDPAALCQKGGCKQNADGSYDLNLAMTFAPQRWLYVGALVSAVTFVAGTTYFVYDLRRDRRKGVHYQLWR